MAGGFAGTGAGAAARAVFAGAFAATVWAAAGAAEDAHAVTRIAKPNLFMRPSFLVKQRVGILTEPYG